MWASTHTRVYLRLHVYRQVRAYPFHVHTYGDSSVRSHHTRTHTRARARGGGGVTSTFLCLRSVICHVIVTDQVTGRSHVTSLADGTSTQADRQAELTDRQGDMHTHTHTHTDRQSEAASRNDSQTNTRGYFPPGLSTYHKSCQPTHTHTHALTHTHTHTLVP